MEQQITLEQLRELTEGQEIHLRDWIYETYWTSEASMQQPISFDMKVNLGQMIEFLNQQCQIIEENSMNDTGITHLEIEGGYITPFTVRIVAEDYFDCRERTSQKLRDALWEVVKCYL